jgi:hypothetical protein
LDHQEDQSFGVREANSRAIELGTENERLDAAGERGQQLKILKDPLLKIVIF